MGWLVSACEAPGADISQGKEAGLDGRLFNGTGRKEVKPLAGRSPVTAASDPNPLFPFQSPSLRLVVTLQVGAFLFSQT